MDDSSHRSLPYKPALDGLRAVAVLSVILYHVGVSWMPGGFLGVDVFFVLSGYLITSLLRLEQIETATIQLRVFWGRRLRRLVPALLAVLTAVVAYGSMLAEPSERERLASDGLSSLFYVSNWHFIARETSYFDQFNAPSPLLHTWSLGIEEQWYLIWPIVMILAARWLGNREGRGAIGFGCAAIASAVWMAVLFDPSGDPSRVYYGTDTRAQDLLVGCALAFLLGDPRSVPRSVPGWLGPVCGLLVVLGLSLASDRSAWTYRGGLLVFALATGGVISAAVQPGGWTRRVLCTAPLRYIGKISYGMYLWHWPLLLFLGSGGLGLDGISLQLGCLALTGMVAGVSYHVLESPIRAGALHGRRIQALAVASVAAIASSFLAMSLSVPSLGPTQGVGDFAGSTSRGKDPVRVMVVGDSIAFTLAHGFSRASLSDQLTLANEALLGCSVARGVLSYADIRRPLRKACAHWPRAWREASTKFQPDLVVVLGGAWEVVDRIVGDTHYRTKTPQYARYIADSLEIGLTAIADSSAHVVFLTTPCLKQRWGTMLQPGNVPAPQQERNEPARVKWFNRVLRNFVSAHPQDTSLIDLHGYACPGGEFPEAIDGLELQPDGVHFSLEGAALIWRWLAPQLTEIAERHRNSG
ncbi:MAG: acyltransferase family protein [Deltaproteobacteria bacterium]|nr:acyltransferase family protein [Deltaproteobacteria bacterium]MBW2724098.1 acyltransferase family protein [Deltaproteobacteria bacterium]